MATDDFFRARLDQMIDLRPPFGGAGRSIASQHTPLPRDALLDSMEALFDLVIEEPEPAVRAVLGHHLFVFVHPYFDGNGRLERFLMNTMLASGGYPWTVIRMNLFSSISRPGSAVKPKTRVAAV